jgi:parallel beta-helix repeat protein
MPRPPPPLKPWASCQQLTSPSPMSVRGRAQAALTANVHGVVGPPVALDRERNRVLVAEALQRAAMVANNGNLDAACLLLAETQAVLASAPSTLARDPVADRLLEVITVAVRRLDQVLSEFKSRTSSSSLLDKPGGWSQPLTLRSDVRRRPRPRPRMVPTGYVVPSRPRLLGRLLPSGGALACSAAAAPRSERHPNKPCCAVLSAQAQSSPLMGVLIGGPVPPSDARAPLKPRTFSVSLPFSSLGAGAARSDANNPSLVGANTIGATTNLHDGGSSSTNSSAIAASSSGGGGSLAANSGDSTPWQRRALLLRDGTDATPAPVAEGDSSTHCNINELTLRSGAGMLGKSPPLRLLGSVSFANGKRGRVGGTFRGRPRLQPPVLMPLHAPPVVRDANNAPAAAPPLGIGPPLPPAGATAKGVQGSYESWLCRLMRTPLRPLPLPDELIAHIFSFLQPAVLFHESLSLPSLIVDKCTTTVRGHYTTISAALRSAQPGDRLLIRPGVYRESLRIDVPVMLLGCPSGGHGASSSVTITSSRNHTVHSTASFARMDHITLRQTGSSGRSCLLVSRGRLDVSDCDISSASGLCVEVTDSAAPIVRHSRIHGGAAAGLWFRASGGGLVEGNEIWGNGWSGVQISDESNPELLRNYIHDNKSAGIISFNHGRGIARHNDITSNGKGGVQVRSRASPELVCNRIFAERSFGVWVYEHGLGRFEDNDIVNNAWSGFQVEESSAPNVVGNRLRGNRSAGIVVYNRGSGTYEWNDISCNGRCGVQIKSGSAPTFRHNRIHHEKQAGVLTAEDGTGVLEDNDIFDNRMHGGSSPALARPSSVAPHL